MIRVHRKEEPLDFDARVRQPGLSAIDELVGRPPRLRRRGPRRAKVAETEEQIKPYQFPAFWTESLDQMMVLYEQRCAYLGLHLERSTGNPSVDHFVAKAKDWRLVYEWSNYRLSASLVNARKGVQPVIDPFEVEEGWFALNLDSLYVEAGPSAPADRFSLIDSTLPILNLPECRKDRGEYIRLYRLGPGQGGIDLHFLRRRAPFVAREMERQGALLPEDAQQAADPRTVERDGR